MAASSALALPPAPQPARPRVLLIGTALAAGAALVNDVSGGLADPAMPALVAASGAPFVVMHWRGHAHDMQSRALYTDVIAEVRAELGRRVLDLLDAGIGADQLILDPGIGFAKNAEHNWTLLAGLEQIVHLGHPILLGTSRKGFLGTVGRYGGEKRALDARVVVTAMTSVRAARAGAWCVRVHDVTATVDAIDVAVALGEIRS